MNAIVEANEGIEMIKAIVAGYKVHMGNVADVESWLGLKKNAVYTRVKNRGLCHMGGGRYEEVYTVINENGRLVDVSGAFCTPFID